jgi:tetratricopeptide (TPR) repeat protein
LLEDGRYSEAIVQFEAYASLAPREPNPLDSLGEAYLNTGDAEKAVEAFSRAMTIDPTFPSRNSRALCLAVLGRYDDVVIEHVEWAHQKAMILSRLGRYREAGRALADAEKEARTNGDRSREASVRLIGALLALERNNPEHALRETRSVEPLLATLPDNLEQRVRVVTELIAGLADLQARRQAQALAHFEAQGRAYTSSTEFERTWRHSLEGELALARGDLPHAATAFSAAEPRFRSADWTVPLMSVLVNQLPSRDGPARVALARGDLDGAIRIYRELLVYGPQSKWIAPMEPLYVLQIARLLEKKGDGKAALGEYQRFLRLWKNADVDLPELAEARRAVKRLEARS